MPKLAANLTMLFNEVDFLDRFAAAAKAGFKASSTCFRTTTTRTAAARAAAAKTRLTQVLHNLPAGNWAAGERGIGCHPDRVGEFEEGVGKAIEYATALGCKQVNCLAGIAPAGRRRRSMRARRSSTNLQFAAHRSLKAAGIKLLIEPINTRDIPGFFLCNTQQALDIIDAVGSDNLFLQYDIYHMQIMEGDLAPHDREASARNRAHAARRQPGPQRAGHRRDQLRFPVRAHRPLGYDGWIGCEYKPKTTTDRRASAGPSRISGRDAASFNDGTIAIGDDSDEQHRIHRPRHHGQTHGGAT